MFDFAWSELGVIAIVALVVIGPKDLPRVMRTVGTWVRKARSIAREFQSSLEQMAQESDFADAKKELDKMSDIGGMMTSAVDPAGEIKDALHMPAVPDPTMSPTATPAPEAKPPTEAAGNASAEAHKP